MDLPRAQDTQHSQVCWISAQQHSHPSSLEEGNNLFSCRAWGECLHSSLGLPGRAIGLISSVFEQSPRAPGTTSEVKWAQLKGRCLNRPDELSHTCPEFQGTNPAQDEGVSITQNPVSPAQSCDPSSSKEFLHPGLPKLPWYGHQSLWLHGRRPHRQGQSRHMSANGMTKVFPRIMESQVQPRTRWTLPCSVLPCSV